MMITPATLARTLRYCIVNWPSVVATAPKVMKTTLNPRMNVIEFSITERINLRSAACSDSTLAPEISETYPGTSGNTQGDRNESKPAAKAAIGKGRLDINYYCTARALTKVKESSSARTSVP